MLASKKGLTWSTPTDPQGKILPAFRWDLASMAVVRGPGPYFSDTAPGPSALASLNFVRAAKGLPAIQLRRPAEPWVDLMKMVVVDHVFIRFNRPRSIIRTLTCVRILAAEAEETPPWELWPEMVRRSYTAALEIGSSGKTALDLSTTVRTVFDDAAICEVHDLGRYCQSIDDPKAEELVNDMRRSRNGHHSRKAILERLNDRPSPEKLPDEDSFEKLKTIILSTRPKNFSDSIRFAALRLHLTKALRIEEILSAPASCLLSRDYASLEGVSVKAKGGIARDVWFRYLAAKKPPGQDQSIMLFEDRQHVPVDFQDVFIDTVQKVLRLTAPARERLKLQAETGRLFPEFDPWDLVPAHEMYVRLTGNAFFSKAAVSDELIELYRRSGDLQHLRQIRAVQMQDPRPSHSQTAFWSSHGFTARDADGAITSDRSSNGRFYRVGEVEQHLGRNLTTKGPEITRLAQADGNTYATHDMLFLMPVRNLVEGRNEGLLDIERYYAFKRIDYADINNCLDGNRRDSIFQRYLGPEGRQYRIKTHQNRHLQTTELYRNGASDIQVQKRFKRTSMTQARVYDNRSLAERNAALDLGETTADLLSEPQKRALEAIQSGNLAGPKVRTFQSIRDKEGFDAAIRYLAGAFSGFHVTPMGACTTNFLADPCARHLECFNDCSHLHRTNNPREEAVLRELLGRLLVAEEALLKIPEAKRRNKSGWQNQLAHVRSHIAATRRTLETRPGRPVFPEGRDLMRPIPLKSGVLSARKPT